ncbi:MAG TPA: D-sedoheptulose 7-phosphate isomerase [Candidatus Omnitrophota bacterium]|nr:D-sedoheptulose 7-phosphate isomerase [Candidatus Omnitrophota bacterium]HQL41984.1 D-sedoheptulose 7-phosphate isomerase [Candidatus Omnitrophota bacterium]
MQDNIQRIFNESIEVKRQTLACNSLQIEHAAKAMIQSLEKGGKILLFGNGGSAADSQHVAAEFIGRFQRERRSLAAIALSTDTSIITALGNDYSFDIIFSRQIEGLGRSEDIAVGLSTSGNSKNVVEGIKAAKKIGMKTISLTGNDGGQVAKLTDISLIVPSRNTARVQEAHSCLAHILCELIEDYFQAS